MKLLLLYLLIVNTIGLIQMYEDKQRAMNGKYRIPEMNLWRIAIAGGALGSTVGMNLFRHKTKHTNFKYGMPLLALVHIGALIYFIGR